MADVHAHNQRVLATLERGDAVEFKRSCYSHWGLYIGNGKIIHMTSPRPDAESGSSHLSSGCSTCGLNIDKAIIKIDDFFYVAGGSKAYKNNSKDKYLPVRSVDEIIAYARSLIGKINYNCLWQNCEHFVSCCRNYKPTSEQADTVKTVGAVAFVGAVGAGALAYMLGGTTKTEEEED